jgi:hypothetical protein
MKLRNDHPQRNAVKLCNSKVHRLLAERGYRMIAFQNSYSFSITNADIYYDNAPMRPFIVSLLTPRCCVWYWEKN